MRVKLFTSLKRFFSKMEIIGDIKTYEWGKIGTNSKVAQLGKLNNNDFEISNDVCYAELWMGDHPSGPSKFKGTGELLGDVINKNRDKYIGGMEKLPFLFKVLSINKALSIQVHPNKEEAEELFAKRPDLYKDPNHKPELAIALTPFLALCGFRPYDEIYNLIQNYPEIKELISNDNVELLKSSNKSDGLKKCFEKLMKSNDAELKKCISKLSEKMNKTDLLSKIFTTLNHEFPNDVGILCIFFMNILELKPGQAIYLAAKEPHAYLSGDCIECMACSDNVVRAGLTPKFKDVETLIKMLNYDAEPAQNKIFNPQVHPKYNYTQLFIPKVKDFAVAKICVPKDIRKYNIENRPYGSILLVLSGKAKMNNLNYSSIDLLPGNIVFIPSDAENEIELEIDNTDTEFIAYQALYNDF